MVSVSQTELKAIEKTKNWNELLSVMRLLSERQDMRINKTPIIKV